MSAKRNELMVRKANLKKNRVGTKKNSKKNMVSMNPGCRACGNPMYPDCMDSCPLFDD